MAEHYPNAHVSGGDFMTDQQHMPTAVAALGDPYTDVWMDLNRQCGDEAVRDKDGERSIDHPELVISYVQHLRAMNVNIDHREL